VKRKRIVDIEGKFHIIFSINFTRAIWYDHNHRRGIAINLFLLSIILRLSWTLLKSYLIWHDGWSQFFYYYSY